MKKTRKILLGINTLTEVNQSAYLNHMTLAYRLGRTYRNWDFGICAPRRMQIDNMRNFCAKAAIEQKFDYLWFIDDDVLIHPDSLKHLLDLESDIAAGITLIRGYPYNPMLFTFKKARKNGPHLTEYESMASKKDGSIRRAQGLDAVGFSCCLIKTSLLKTMEPPWFLTGPNFTEDVFFCQRAIGFKMDTTISASVKVQTEHILGAETICPSNRFARKLFEERLNPGLLKMKNAKSVIMVDKNADRFAVQRGVAIAEAYKVQQQRKA